MTWTLLPKHLFMGGLAVLLLALFANGLSACASPLASRASTQGKGRHCADLVVQAIVSKSGLTASGGYACLDETMQQALLLYAGVQQGDDALLAKVLADSAVTSSKYLGETGDGGYVYILSTSEGSRIQLIWTDADGRIADLAYSQHP